MNARDAMPGGGSLRIESTAIAELGARDRGRAASLAPGRYVTVTVTDTGTGIDAATRTHLFEPFFTTKGPDGGSGLGLSTAQGIARQNGGDLVLDAGAPGQGSSFTLLLPIVDDPVPAPPHVTAPQAEVSTGTILLVEDDPGVRRLTQRILSDAGYTVITAEDGAGAEVAIAGHPASIDLVVSDVIMPGMGGAELAAHVQEKRPGTAVLLMSGYPGDILSQDQMLPPGTHFIGKPFTAAEITAKVREAIGG